MSENNNVDKSGTTTSITKKYPTFRDEPLKTVYRWLDGKREDDGAEGYWRVHDTLYDLTDFVDRHPGGAEWLKLTKGTDITESFETHHITKRAENWLPQFKVGEAKTARNVKFTFKDDGFYRTLKRRVQDKMADIDRKPELYTKIYLDTLIAVSFLLALLTVKTGSFFVAFICGFALAWTTVAAHNFLHIKDNWRMLAYNLSCFSFREWRILHAMSHHLYPNTLLDLEIAFYEPWFMWMPSKNNKNVFQRYGSWVYGPIVYAVILHHELLKRIIAPLVHKNHHYYKEDLVSFILPAFMYIFSEISAAEVLKLWVFIILSASYVFSFIAINAGHHDPDIYHHGDETKSDIDFGLYQMSTVIDRSDIKSSPFMVLTHFGDHCLHHMFPTLDHGVLNQLYPVFYETCVEFEAVLKERAFVPLIIGQHKQLARINE